MIATIALIKNVVYKIIGFCEECGKENVHYIAHEQGVALTENMICCGCQKEYHNWKIEKSFK